ncbi:hypothetical protein IV102_22670, partial [bacterium]|nr:hypothetical protein [bacterium]
MWEPPPSSEPERRTLRTTADTSKPAVPDPASFTGLLRRIPGLLIRQALFRLPAIALTVVPAWMVHTYLVVFKNEGFNGVQHWAAAYCNVTGNGTTAFLSFGLGSAM